MIIGLESPPVLIGMDIRRPLWVHIDVTRGTATPAQPDPQTIHLNAAQTPVLPASSALLLQAVDIPAETARLVRCHNPWPSEDVYFCPEEGLSTYVSGVPALPSGSEVWVAIHIHHSEPLRLHTGQTVGTLKIVTLAGSSPPPPPPVSSQNRQPPVPEHLSPDHQQQLKALFQEFSDIISQGKDDLGTPLLQHTIETEGPRFASRIVAKTQPFAERRWPRSNRCCLAASSVPPIVPGLHQSTWWKKRTAASSSVSTSGSSMRPP